MTTLTTTALSTQVLEDTLLTLEQVTTSITLLALNTSRNPQQSPRFRTLLGDLAVLIQECEDDLGTYTFS
jgi:hypothetical protein